MNKPIAFLLVLWCGSVGAQSTESVAPFAIRAYLAPVVGGWRSLQSDGLSRTRLGLHVETGDWQVDVAGSERVSSLGLNAGGVQRSWRQAPTDIFVGVGRSFSSGARDGWLHDLGSFSLIANFGMARVGDEFSRGLWSGGLGGAWNFSPASSLGVNYRIEANPLPEAPLQRSLGMSYGYQFSSGLRVNTSLDRGLSEGSPRWGGGLSISFSH